MNFADPGSVSILLILIALSWAALLESNSELDGNVIEVKGGKTNGRNEWKRFSFTAINIPLIIKDVIGKGV